MAKPSTPNLNVRRWDAGKWNESPDAVVTEEPLQLMLDGEPLSVVMRTPGQDIELALGLFYSEGIIRGVDDVKRIRISADAGEANEFVHSEASIVESNTVDIQLKGPPPRKPQRSMLSSSACGVCGAVLIDDLKHNLRKLPVYKPIDAATLPRLVDKVRSHQDLFERTGGLHAAALFTERGDMFCAREDVGRHNAVDKVVGRLVWDSQLPLNGGVLVVSGRAGYEIVQKSIAATISILAAVGAPSSLAVALAREFNLTLVGFLRGDRFNVYSTPERLA